MCMYLNLIHAIFYEKRFKRWETLGNVLSPFAAIVSELLKRKLMSNAGHGE